ncbi:MAG TPA: tetratricopeptide repeat protein [Vicinamibacterales bacterium]|nr:tetratricopeptide repeat protein [Vicinamibacterales bacterium]
MSQLPFDVPTDLPLQGETLVFTGRLWSISRKDARAAVGRLGGACDDEVTPRTTLLVVGADTYPAGVPDERALAGDSTAHAQKLRRAAQLNADQPGRIRVITEAEFCRTAGLPDLQDQRPQLYGQKDVLAMYPQLREDHLRYLQKWGIIKPAFRNDADTWFGFADLTTLRQLQTALQQGGSFRALLKELQAARSGQLAFDFRLEAHQARIIELRARRRMAQTEDASPQDAQRAPMEAWAGASSEAEAGLADRTLSTAEQCFLTGSLLDDGLSEHVDEAARLYRRALEQDPDLVAAIINLANIRYAKDELAEAQALYERAIGLDPTYFEAYFNLGNIHHDHGRYLDAEACYREALGLNPTYADAHFYLAVTLEKMGRSADARAHWRAYQTLAPAGEWIELAREFSD